MKYDVIVIGGGAAGMMAAGRAGACGARVLLIEKNQRLGEKLSITGGKRCNITNAEFDTRAFLDNFPQAKQFLYSPFSKFDVESTFKFFEERGLPIVVEDRKRAFPKSQKAEDVRNVMEDFVEESGKVTVQLGADFSQFILEEEKVVGVRTDKGEFYAERFIIATGGMAAPETGSTGEWISAAEAIGHKVKMPDPNLSPLRTNHTWVHELSGLAIDDMELRFIQEGKQKLKKRGRMLFTHFGISGPLVINSAYEVKELLAKGEVEASIDLFPDDDHKALNIKLLDLIDMHGAKSLENLLKLMLPNKLVAPLLKFAQVRSGGDSARELSKLGRKSLVHAMKALTFPIQGTMGFKWSIIADGGVLPEGIDFKTMQSRVHPNIYFIGDTISINRPSGGYSLQLCWTTGFIAGTDAALLRE